jgi:AhpD family alkylhydroperoxidase
MNFRPETAKPMNELAEVLLRGPSSLSPGERELIAAYVSSENDCFYCQTIHGAPENPATINRKQLGDLKLTGEQEDMLVAFLKTLTDGYSPAK